MRRLTRIADAKFDDNGRSAILDVEFADTATGRVKVEKVEFSRDSLREFIASGLAIAQGFGDKAPALRPLPDTTLAQAVVLPSEEWASQSLPNGGLMILVRVGCQDLAIALPDPRSCELLARALLDRGK
jgi:hypothetical protein